MRAGIAHNSFRHRLVDEYVQPAEAELERQLQKLVFRSRFCSDYRPGEGAHMTPTASDRLTAKGRATRARIVAAASELMLQRGVARTTIEDIQEAAAISTSQMYHYFADKNDLVAAVIDFQTAGVLGVQHLGLDRIDSIQDLYRWRDIMVNLVRNLGCVGGCPIGSMANELSESDPVARARLARSFAQWENMIHDSLVAIAA